VRTGLKIRICVCWHASVRTDNVRLVSAVSSVDISNGVCRWFCKHQSHSQLVPVLSAERAIHVVGSEQNLLGLTYKHPCIESKIRWHPVHMT